MLDATENESAFDKWLTTKNLEEGVKILLRLNKEARTRIDDIIFAAAAIDTASQGCASESKTMKSALRSFMIKNYTFKELPIDKDVYSKFSQHAKEVYVRKVQNPQEEMLRLYSCSFVKCTDGSNTDQKLLNSIFTKEVNRQWGKAIDEFNRKLQSEFGSKIEISQPKLDKEQGVLMNARDAKSKDLDHKSFSSEAKSSRKDDCSISSSLFISEAKKTKLPDSIKINHKPLAAPSYKISNRRYVHYLSLALQTLKDVENEIQKEGSKKKIMETERKEAESKATHENWIKEKMRIAQEKRRIESVKLKKEPHRSMFEPIFSAHVNRSSKKISQADEDNSEYSDDATILSIEPVMPKIWAREIEGNNKMIHIYWESKDDNVEFYTLSLYDKKGKSPHMHWRDPSRDEDEPKMRKTFSFPPGDYWLGITATSFQGSSPQARIQILSKAITPGFPTLSKASDTCLDINWSDNREILSGCQEEVFVPPIDENNRDFMYIVEQSTNDNKWEELWVGSTNFASISGLIPDESYRLRVYVKGRNDNLSSPYGEAKVYHTLPRPPSLLQIASPVNKVDPIGKNYAIISWEYSQAPKSNKKQRHQWLRQILQDNILMSEWKHISNSLGIPDLSEQEKEQLSSTASIGIIKFLNLWSAHLNFVLYQSTDERASHKDMLSTGKIVFNGVGNNVTVNDLIPDSTYTFRLQCKTLRGQSALSPPLVIHTKPESPNAVLIVHIGSNEVILNILKPQFGGKILVEMRLTKQSNTNDCQWKKMYVGHQDIVKVPNLRPSKEYEIRARLLNKVGKSGACISRSIQTLDKPYIVDSTTILTLFPIDCIDIVEGDLILFSDIDERAIAARIISLNTVITMEIVWTSDKASYEVPGTVIERDLPALRKYEVLRTPWIDERGRCLKE